MNIVRVPFVAALVVAFVVALWSVGAARAVPVTIDPGLFIVGPDSGDSTWYAVSSIPGVWLWETRDAQTVDVPVGSHVDVYIQWPGVGPGVWPGAWVGLFTVHDDGAIVTPFPDAFTVAGSTVTFNTHPVTLDTTGYDSGMWINNVNWQAGASGHQFTYNLPATLSGAYAVTTPGGRTGLFTVATDGTVAVTDPGPMGLAVVDGALRFTNTYPIEYKWAGQNVPDDLLWWAGDGPQGGGPDKGVAGVTGVVPGEYAVSWSTLPAGNWYGGATFVVPETIQPGWTKTLTYNTVNHGPWTLTLSYPVPEPAALTLLALGGMAVMLRRRRTSAE
ncbi:MAG: PEP-CTERM sorting domain-containing protein [Phycisphaerae bacterium]|nr:PEP-CTERM sorting domain-containing protein [Phycisphaerae bacterium]